MRTMTIKHWFPGRLLITGLAVGVFAWMLSGIVYALDLAAKAQT